jgi:tetratricopeptide (TPR) repeat protein
MSETIFNFMIRSFPPGSVFKLRSWTIAALCIVFLFLTSQISDFGKMNFVFTFQTPTVFAADRYPVPEKIVGLINQGNREEARKALEEYRRKDPGNPLAIFYLAQVTDDPKMAQALFKEVELLADKSLASEAVFARAELNFHNGSYSEAGEIYEKITAQYPSSSRYADAFYRLGMTSLASGKLEKALAAYRKCLETEKRNDRKTLAEAGIMECFVVLKDWNSVLESARKVLMSTDDGNALTPRVLEVTAMAWHELGNDENAEKFTQRLVANFPESYQTHALKVKGNLNLTVPKNLRTQKVKTDSIDSFSDTFQNGQSADTSQDNYKYSLSEKSVSDKTGAEYSIQAAAFEDRFNALKLHTRLKDAGFPSRVEMKTVGIKHFYLIRVGSYTDREEAEKISVQVSKISNTKASVIVTK